MRTYAFFMCYYSKQNVSFESMLVLDERTFYKEVQNTRKEVKIPCPTNNGERTLARQRSLSITLPLYWWSRNNCIHELCHFRIVGICLGIPPTEFSWEYYDKSKEYKKVGPITPLDFHNNFVSKLFNVDDKVKSMHVMRYQRWLRFFTLGTKLKFFGEKKCYGMVV